MARARNIKPGFFKNYELADLGPLSQMLFAGLWCLADREGRLEDKPRYIKAEIFPYYECDVAKELERLERSGFVRRYVCDGSAVIEVMNFKKHQTPHHTEKASALPDFDEETASKPAPMLDNSEPTVKHQEHNGGNPPDSLIPDSLIPDSLIPDSGFTDPLSTPTPAGECARPRKPRSKQKPTEPGITIEAWASYSQAYLERYGVLPVDNGSQRGKLAGFVRKIGRDEAPAVARHFVQSRQQWYVQKKHALGCLVEDAEKLRTEWVTGQTTYQRDAREEDRLASTGEMWDRVGQKLAEKGIT